MGRPVACCNCGLKHVGTSYLRLPGGKGELGRERSSAAVP